MIQSISFRFFQGVICVLFMGCYHEVPRFDTLNDTSPLFKSIYFSSTPPLKTLYRADANAQVLWVVIEGDGHAWMNPHKPTADPTPYRPIGWAFAQSINQDSILYLTRPCQYLDKKERQACTSIDWTNGRFASKWVDLLNHSIDIIKKQMPEKNIILVGYSGGGTMATLMATRRDDVSLLITIASPLDTDAWTKYHHVSSLDASLNPKVFQTTLVTLKQIHLVGKYDDVVPKFLIYDFLRSYSSQKSVRVIEIEADHIHFPPLDWQKLKNSFSN
ncbi:MAG: hypothetical protein JXQ68_00150 [Campylobacterales bacterium]|nr:hypothetical protein [Campylobacterales bacterium]